MVRFSRLYSGNLRVYTNHSSLRRGIPARDEIEEAADSRIACVNWGGSHGTTTTVLSNVELNTRSKKVDTSMSWTGSRRYDLLRE